MHGKHYLANTLRYALLLALVFFNLEVMAVAPGGMFHRIESGPHSSINMLPGGLTLTRTPLSPEIKR